jgi:cytochrome c biogenesis protein CcmG, thiol:disulfide interchange protein DsbE
VLRFQINSKEYVSCLTDTRHCHAVFYPVPERIPEASGLTKPPALFKNSINDLGPEDHPSFFDSSQEMMVPRHKGREVERQKAALESQGHRLCCFHGHEARTRSRRGRHPRGALSAILCLLLVSAAPAAERGKALRIGERPPEFSLSDLSGRLVSLYQSSGKITVLTFWNDSCHKAGSPLIDEAFYQKFKDRGLAILAINSGQPQRVVEAFLRNNRLKVSYDILLDLRFTATKEYGVMSLPMVFIVDRTGVIRERILGEVDPKYLEKLVESLL